MDFKEIQELIKLINKSNLTEFKMKDGDFQLSIRTKKYGRGKQQILPITTSVPSVQQSFVPSAPAPASAPVPAPVVEKSKEKASAEASADTSKYLEIKSPIVGTFYRSPSPDKPPFVTVGDTITNDSVVCIVEAMKLFNEIEAEVSGRIVEILVEDASPVEYDQVLFKVEQL